MPLLIHSDLTRNMKGIAHHPQHPKGTPASQTSSQAITSPSDQVVSQLRQQHQHFLGGQAFLVALGYAQSFFTPAQAGFRRAAAIVVSSHRGPENSRWDGVGRRCLAGHLKELGIGQIEDQDVIAPLAILLAVTQTHLTSRLVISVGGGHPTDLSMRYLGVWIPPANRPTQLGRPAAMLDFAQEQVATVEQPVEVLIATTASIHADHGAQPMTWVEVEDVFGGQHQFLQTTIQLSLARIQAVDHDFIVQRGHDTPHLPTTPPFLTGKVAASTPSP